MKINLETKTNFIETVETEAVGGGMPWDLITLKSGAVLVITEESVGVYPTKDDWLQGTGNVVEVY